MGVLDGVTLLRYGHSYGRAGGMELYLSDLNAALHRRNDFCTVQVEMTEDRSSVGMQEERVARGRLVRVRVFVSQDSHERAIAGSTVGTSAWRRRVLGWPGVGTLATRAWGRFRGAVRRPGEPDGAGAVVGGLIDSEDVGLLVLHSAGGLDTAESLVAAALRGVPATYVHHFSNERLISLSLGAQLAPMAAFGGVTSTDVPRRFRRQFRFLGDGVDTEFWRPDPHAIASQDRSCPTVFLPARLTPSKGQIDLVRAIGQLRRLGMATRLVLAGRVDNESYVRDLMNVAEQEGVAESLELIGPLDALGLREWYRRAAVLAFPTTHHEGLPRILLESQAMQVPPVAYAIGGVREGLVDGVSGYAVGVGDLPALVARVHELLANRDRRRTMAEAGRQFVLRSFTLDGLAARHEQLYASVLR